jgi:hypothetical protein
MPIPTEHDRRLAHVDQLARSVVAYLTTLHQAGEKDRLRTGATFRDRLRQFVDAALNCADERDD